MTTTAGTVLDRPDKPLSTEDLEDLIPLLHEHAPTVSPAPPAFRIPTPREPQARERREPQPAGRRARMRPLYWRRRGPVLVGGVLVGLAAAAIAAVMITTSEPAPQGPPGQMGLSQQAWQEYRAGERASAVGSAPAELLPSDWQQYRSGERAGAADQVHLGLTQQGWRTYRAGEAG